VGGRERGRGTFTEGQHRPARGQAAGTQSWGGLSFRDAGISAPSWLRCSVRESAGAGDTRAPLVITCCIRLFPPLFGAQMFHYAADPGYAKRRPTLQCALEEALRPILCSEESMLRAYRGIEGII